MAEGVHEVLQARPAEGDGPAEEHQQERVVAEDGHRKHPLEGSLRGGAAEAGGRHRELAAGREYLAATRQWNQASAPVGD